jgi:transcription antitermination factor NusG
MQNPSPSVTAFKPGDQVLLARGSYQGTSGVFLRLHTDTNWADIQEQNGSIRMHPVAWLTDYNGKKEQTK